MRDCDTCQLYRNDECAGLSCQGYKPVPFIDPEVMKSAQDANDNRMHRGNKYGSRNVAAREEKIKQSQTKRENDAHKSKSSKKEHKKTITDSNRHDTNYKSNATVAVIPVDIGQKLFYRDKETGVIKHGTIVGVSKRQFLFRFDSQAVWLNNEVINNRLFYTQQEAQKNSRFNSR